MLTVKEAGELLELGNERNPGPWKRHSLSAAENARLIGQKAGMDGEKAYVMGCFTISEEERESRRSGIYLTAMIT